jgi:hypothetical protein
MLIDDGPDVCDLGNRSRVLAFTRFELVIINYLFLSLDRAPGCKSTGPPACPSSLCIAEEEQSH